MDQIFQENTTDSAPFFSIITVVWNNLTGLKLTKESLYEQVCQNWEWVIVDGASTDGTREFALACAGDRVRAISERDRGIYDAMNKGLLLAKGKYVIFLNSGDLLATKASLEMACNACEGEDPDVLFCSSIMDFGVMRISRPVKPTSYIWHGQPGLHQATAFRRKKHVQFPFDLSYSVCGDYDALTRMAAAGLSMRSVPILLSINEFNAAAISGRKKRMLISEAARAQRRNLRLSYPRIGISILRRVAVSIVSKIIASADLLKNKAVRDRA